jgi:hypothetical protein
MINPRIACAIGLLMSFVGCANDDWVYRPRDGAADAGGLTDVPSMDLGSARDVVPGPDGARVDGSMGGPDIGARSDVGFSDGGTPAVDARMADGGSMLTGLALRAQGIASVGGAPTAGTLRLTETGFEFGDRACTGGLCIVGGLVP